MDFLSLDYTGEAEPTFDGYYDVTDNATTALLTARDIESFLSPSINWPSDLPPQEPILSQLAASNSTAKSNADVPPPGLHKLSTASNYEDVQAACGNHQVPYPGVPNAHPVIRQGYSEVGIRSPTLKPECTSVKPGSRGGIAAPFPKNDSYLYRNGLSYKGPAQTASGCYGPAQAPDETAQASCGHAQASYRHAQASYRHAQASYRHAEASYGHAHALYGHAQASYGIAQASYGQEQASYGQEQASFGHSQVSYGHAQTSYGSVQPQYSAVGPEVINLESPVYTQMSMMVQRQVFEVKYQVNRNRAATSSRSMKEPYTHQFTQQPSAQFIQQQRDKRFVPYTHSRRSFQNRPNVQNRLHTSYSSPLINANAVIKVTSEQHTITHMRHNRINSTCFHASQYVGYVHI